MLVEKNTTHIVFQPKGGVGKTYIAYILSNIALNEKLNSYIVDTDYINPYLTRCLSKVDNNITIINGKQAINFFSTKELFEKSVTIADISNVSSSLFLTKYYVKYKNYLEKSHKLRSRKIFYHLPLSEFTNNSCILSLEEYLPYIKNNNNNYILWIFGSLEFKNKVLKLFEDIVNVIHIPYKHPFNLAMYECYITQKSIEYQKSAKTQTVEALSYIGLYNLQMKKSL